MTFRRTFHIEELSEHSDRYVMTVAVPDMPHRRLASKMSFALAQDQYEQITSDSPVYLSATPASLAVVSFEGKVTARTKGDRYHAVDFQVGPDGHKQYATIDVDEKAFGLLAVGTPLFLYVLREDVAHRNDGQVIMGEVNAANVSSGTLLAESMSMHSITTGVPHHWRFELTLDDAATVPFQQLCRLGLLIGQSGGEIADGQFAVDGHHSRLIHHRDTAMTTMLVRGPGVAPPDALFLWCRDNGVTCAVRADA